MLNIDRLGNIISAHKSANLHGVRLIMITVHPLTTDLWPELESLFGPQGACYGCWCTYFRLEPKIRASLSGAEKREVLRAAVGEGLPPGLIALDRGEPVGWVQVTPRFEVPRWNSDRTVSRPLADDNALDAGHWAISCFFIKSGRRGEGISHALVRAATRHAHSHGARLIDACPMLKAKRSGSIGLYVGSVSVFAKAGYEVVAERKEGRPLMRKVFK